MSGYDNLLFVQRFFKIKVNNEALIRKLCETKSIRALHNALILIEQTDEKFQVFILKQMLAGNSELLTTALIYISIHNNLKKYL